LTIKIVTIFTGSSNPLALLIFGGVYACNNITNRSESKMIIINEIDNILFQGRESEPLIVDDNSVHNTNNDSSEESKNHDQSENNEFKEDKNGDVYQVLPLLFLIYVFQKYKYISDICIQFLSRIIVAYSILECSFSIKILKVPGYSILLIHTWKNFYSPCTSRLYIFRLFND
jgi:hypothetical protein